MIGYFARVFRLYDDVCYRDTPRRYVMVHGMMT